MKKRRFSPPAEATLLVAPENAYANIPYLLVEDFSGWDAKKMYGYTMN